MRRPGDTFLRHPIRTDETSDPHTNRVVLPGSSVSSAWQRRVPASSEQLTAVEDRSLVGWTYWSWKYYGDPTGSADEALVTTGGTLRSTAQVLSRTYPEAITGKPVSVSFDPATGAFRLIYRPDRSVHTPTVVFVPTQIHYPRGYCAQVTGATVVSKPDSEYLQVANEPRGNSVAVTVTSGTCPHG